MKLVGMLDSPFVRRVAVSLQLLGIDFEHQSLSLFRTYDEFKRINPVARAPTLVCDDGTVLMDSTLILEYAEALAAPRSLMPAALADRRTELELIGLALALCEKSVQLFYERMLRPPERRHQPWVDRVTEQLLAAHAGLEQRLARRPMACTNATISQAGVSVAVAWTFTQRALAGAIDAAAYPALAAHAAAAEALPAFAAAPHGEQTLRR